MSNEYPYRTNLSSLNISRGGQTRYVHDMITSLEPWSVSNSSDKNDYNNKTWTLSEFPSSDGMSLFPASLPQEESPSPSPQEKSVINSSIGDVLEVIPSRKANPFESNKDDYSHNNFHDANVRTDYYRTHPVPPGITSFSFAPFSNIYLSDS